MLSKVRYIGADRAAQAVAALGETRDVVLFTHGTLEVEVYAPRGEDRQRPHARDEIYVVVTGSGEFVCEGERYTIGPSDMLFAGAGEVHRFENFTDDLSLWVFFYGPEGGEAGNEK